MMTLTERRNAAGLSQAALAKLAKTSQPQVKRLEAGEREMTWAWALRLAPHLKCRPQDLFFAGITVRIVGFIIAGSEAHYPEESDGYLGLAIFPMGGSERTVAVEVRGDSLGAPFDGWIVYYDDRRDPPTDDLLGSLCVIGLHSGQVFVKTLMRGRIPGHYDLFPGAGGIPMTDQAVAWAARVTAIMPPSYARVEFTEEPEPVAETPASAPRKRRPKK